MWRSESKVGRLAVVIVVLLASLQVVAPGDASAAPASASQPERVPDQLIIGFQRELDEAARGAIIAKHGGRLVQKLDLIDAQLIGLPAGQAVEAVAQAFRTERGVRYAAPNNIYHAHLAPNDPRYTQGLLWGLKNTGQYVPGILGRPGTTGIAGADISAERAWDITKGSGDVVVGVIDSGIDYTHPDLVANLWTAPPGWTVWNCPAGTHGVDFSEAAEVGVYDCDPEDGFGHGTHVAGIIGAAGNNNIGVAGVNWNVKIMALRFIDSNNSGSDDEAILAIDYAVKAKQAGVNLRVLNNSWGGKPGGAPNPALLDAIKVANANGILFVVSAGNDSNNNDAANVYPANYDVPSIISVAATDNRDQLGSFSNYDTVAEFVSAAEWPPNHG